MNAWTRVGRGAGGVARESAWGARGAWADATVPVASRPVGSIRGVVSVVAGAATAPSPYAAAAEATRLDRLSAAGRSPTRPVPSPLKAERSGTESAWTADGRGRSAVRNGDGGVSPRSVCGDRISIGAGASSAGVAVAMIVVGTSIAGIARGSSSGLGSTIDAVGVAGAC